MRLDQRQAGALEIEITRDMIEAGVVILADYEPDRGISLSELAEAVFSAMFIMCQKTSSTQAV